MGLFTKDIKTMDDLLLHGLKDVYYTENQIVKSLPKLIDKATNRDLTKGLKDHLEETRNKSRGSIRRSRNSASSRRACNAPQSMGLLLKQTKWQAKLRTSRSLMPQ
jgi:ferritin-like metal-binding protein YciE